MKREIKTSEKLNEEFHEGYLKEELRKMNPDPVDRIGQELAALYTIPRAYVRDWWFVSYNQMRSLMNRDHWRYTRVERIEFVEMIRARTRIVFGIVPEDDELTEELF